MVPQALDNSLNSLNESTVGREQNNEAVSWVPPIPQVLNGIPHQVVNSTQESPGEAQSVRVAFSFYVKKTPL